MRSSWWRIVIVGMGLIGAAVLFSGSEAGKIRTTGEMFHEKTMLGLKSVLSSLVIFSSPPAMQKRYGGSTMIRLPKPDFTGGSLETAIKNRRSVRNFSKTPMSLLELSQLLFAAQGITGHEQGQALRAAPSAGALYPVELYAVVFAVAGIKPGIYHYAADGHLLELVKQGDFSRKLIGAALDQEMVGRAAVSFVLTAVFERSTHKYGQRGYRYAYLEAGHIGQNMSLQAVSLGLGSVCVGAFFDGKINSLLGVDPAEEVALYILSVGRP